MAQQDVVIIGGGISGLSLAFYCSQAGMKTTLIEKDKAVGGSFASHHYSSNGDSFWLELGAHTCYSSYQNLLGIVDACGIFDTIIPREKVPFTLLRDGEVKSFMSGLGIPELLVSAPNLFRLKKDNMTVKEYYSKIVGANNYSNTVSHFFNAVPSQVTDDFPADMMFKSRPKRKDVLKNYTFRDGLQSVAHAIAARKGIDVRTGSAAESVTISGGNYVVRTEDGQEYTAGSLALALPSAAASRLLQNVNQAVAHHLSLLKYADVDSVGVVVRKENVSLKPVAAIISPNDTFFSVVSRDTVKDDNFRGFAFHFRPGLDDNAKFKRISDVLGIGLPKIEHTFTKMNIVPSLRKGHREWARKADDLLAGARKLYLSGNYFGGMAIEDCVSRSHDEFDRMAGGK
ncbi:MAG: FAD-dependent oxidoreductase [Chlorobiaceae bacterium]|nr:FAD-dependent oxidoreductase [Chlorobiaceae bacterium]